MLPQEQPACQISPPFPASELFAPKLLQDEDVVGNSSVAIAQSEHKVLDYEHNKSFNIWQDMTREITG